MPITSRQVHYAMPDAMPDAMPPKSFSVGRVFIHVNDGLTMASMRVPRFCLGPARIRITIETPTCFLDNVVRDFAMECGEIVMSISRHRVFRTNIRKKDPRGGGSQEDSAPWTRAPRQHRQLLAPALSLLISCPALVRTGGRRFHDPPTVESTNLKDGISR